MKRFHVHLAVTDLAASTAFYKHLFGEPSKVEDDYVKWMVDDPCLNFAISARGHAPGLNHLGIQLESDTDLKAMRRKLEEADQALVAQESADCCYATSDKYWVTDPGGVAWETFHTLATIPTFGEHVVPARDPRAVACCAPVATVPSGCCAKTADR